jgi:biotin operon repressor
MRFAPPNPLRIADRASGLNSLSVRSHNERLVLSLLLQNEGTSRMEIGEKTGLSAQTISVIVRSLEQEGLIARGEAQRGRVGPPAIPLSLNPEGACSVGISLGSKFIDVVLIDFVGSLRHRATFPLPVAAGSDLAKVLADAVRQALEATPTILRSRIAGVGLAIPDDMDSLKFVEGDKALEAAALQRYLEVELGLPVFVQNDITAAAGGESMFGVAKSLNDYLFFFLGGKLRSRLILNHQIFHGNSNISYDVGLFRAERIIEKYGLPADFVWEREADWPLLGGSIDEWKAECVEKLAESVAALRQFVDIRTVVLSSFAPTSTCKMVCEALKTAIPDLTALPGAIGFSPKAVGVASVPFSSRFMVQ